MNDQERTEKLLDEVVARIKGIEVPHCPGPPTVSDRTVLQPFATRCRRLVAAMAVVSGCLVAAIAFVMRHQPEAGPKHVADRPATAESPQAAANPIRMLTIDPAPGLERMLEQIDRISERLDQLEIEVTLQEVRSDSAALLAEYMPRQTDVR